MISWCPKMSVWVHMQFHTTCPERTKDCGHSLSSQWLHANEPYFNHRGALQYCVMPHGIATSLRAYAASAAVDGFWLGTLFFHWAAGLLRSDTPACTKCRGCAHKQVACDSVKLPVYNYLLYDSEVARGHTRTLGNLRLVEPFVTAPPHILQHGLSSQEFAGWLSTLTSADFCPVRPVPGDFICPQYAVVVCNSIPGIHWDDCSRIASPCIPSLAPSTRSAIASTPVRVVFSIHIDDDDAEIRLAEAIAKGWPLVIKDGWSPSICTAVRDHIAIAARADKNLYFTDRGNKVALEQALHVARHGGSHTVTYNKIVAGNVPVENHLFANSHPLANVWLDPLHPQVTRVFDLMRKTSYYPPMIGWHWSCVPSTDILIPTKNLTVIQSDHLVTILDTMYTQFKRPGGFTKTQDTMPALSPDDVDCLHDVLSTVDELSIVKSRSHRGITYVPTSTCIHFMIITAHDKQARHTPCHQDEYTNRHCVLTGTKVWVFCPPDSFRHSSATAASGHITEMLGCTHSTHPQLPWQLAVLGPGDSLVLPENWWHCVTSSAPSSVAVTTFVPHLLELPPPAPDGHKSGKVRGKSTPRTPYSATNGPRSSVGSAICIDASSSDASDAGSQVCACSYDGLYIWVHTQAHVHIHLRMSMPLGTACTARGNTMQC